MAVRRPILFAVLAVCLALADSAWAGSLEFHGDSNFPGEGELNFNPGVGNALTIGAGNGGNGALITDFFNNHGICSGDCSVVGGYLTLTSGGQLACLMGGCASGGGFNYSFGSGGNIEIIGEIPTLGINTPTILFTASFLAGSFTGGGGVGSFTAGINLASVVLSPQLGMYKYSGADNDDIAPNVALSCSTGGICSGAVMESDTPLQTVPEPATLSVLGVGLSTFGVGMCRRMAANRAPLKFCIRC